MKKTLIALMALAGAAAADTNLDLVYIGVDNGIANIADNWYNVNDPDAPSAPGNGDTLWIGYDTDKQASTPVTVVVDNTKTMFRSYIHIAEGSTLKTTAVDWAAWATEFTFNSADALIIGNKMWGGYKNTNNSGGAVADTPMVLNVGTNGSVRIDGEIDKSNQVYFTFNAEVVGSLTNTQIIHESRVLLTLTNPAASNYSDILTGITTNLALEDGTALTKVDTLDFSNLTMEDVGKYTVSYKQLESGNYGVVVDYVTTTTSIIPEPTTATLSLLTLAGLAARRRRK